MAGAAHPSAVGVGVLPGSAVAVHPGIWVHARNHTRAEQARSACCGRDFVASCGGQAPFCFCAVVPPTGGATPFLLRGSAGGRRGGGGDGFGRGAACGPQQGHARGRGSGGASFCCLFFPL